MHIWSLHSFQVFNVCMYIHTCRYIYIHIKKDVRTHTYNRMYIQHACIHHTSYIHSQTQTCVHKTENMLLKAVGGLKIHTHTDTYIHTCMHACIKTENPLLNAVGVFSIFVLAADVAHRYKHMCVYNMCI
jgi:hypothetical protein